MRYIKITYYPIVKFHPGMFFSREAAHRCAVILKVKSYSGEVKNRRYLRLKMLQFNDACFAKASGFIYFIKGAVSAKLGVVDPAAQQRLLEGE